VEQLEIFLALGSEPQRFWSVHDIFQKIQSSEKSISDCLDFFCRSGLATADAERRFQLTTRSDLVKLAAELQKIYRERRVTVIETIYKKPPGPIQSFADAFKFRKDK